MADTKTHPTALQPLATLDVGARTIGIPDDDLCGGVPLWPWASSGLGVAKGVGKTLINTNPTILLVRLNANVSAYIGFGVCGPAYAFDLQAQGTLEDTSDPEQGQGQKLTLNLQDSNSSAGFFMGDQTAVNLGFGMQVLTVRTTGNIWHLHFKTEWEQLFNYTYQLSFSFIATIIDVILWIIEKSKDDGLEEKPDPDLSSKVQSAMGSALKGTVTTFVMYAAGSGDLSSEGKTTLEPTLAFNINILPFIEGIGEVDKALQKVGITIGAGPTFQLGIPVDIAFNKAYVNCEEFGEGFDVSSGTLTATRYSSTPIASIESVGLGVQHTPGFDFLAGIFFQLTWLKFLNLAPSVTFSVTGLLGLDITTGTYQHVVDDQGRIDPTCGGSLADIEIVFEDHH